MSSPKNLAVNLVNELKRNPFVLAPMAGITDSCFRSFMRELGCGPVVTELVSAHGIEFRSPRTLRLMEFAEMQRPIGIQLFGETPEILALGAKVIESMAADFVDLNFGCPVPKVVKKGAGSAILKDLAQVQRVFRAVRSATSLPVTVKIRTGWDESSRNAAEVAAIAYDEGLTWVAIHGRTRAAGYSGLADWDFIADVKAKSRLPIIGNGDVHDAATAVRRLEETGCDGVMIGRGCLKNPWIFADALQLWSAREPGMGSLSHSVRSGDFPRERDFARLFVRLKESYELSADERITLLQIKKFASWYSSGYPGAAQFRKAIFQTLSLDEAMFMTVSFFNELRLTDQGDTSREAFLMGGHG